MALFAIRVADGWLPSSGLMGLAIRLFAISAVYGGILLLLEGRALYGEARELRRILAARDS